VAETALPTADELAAPGTCVLPAEDRVEVSIVMPCLNEEQTIGTCIQKALDALDRCGVQGEVIVVDNGCTDRSVEIALSFEDRVRVVRQSVPGYGAAYLKGFSMARGRYVIMGDSDNTYDFGDLPRFLTALNNGHDMVLGNRFAGGIHPGAMPWLHRYVGTPLLSAVMNLLYHTDVQDSQSGMRALTREALAAMHLQCTGMELATEMIVKASRAGLHIGEIPIQYYPRRGQSKLRSFRDGWRHLRFMLLSVMDGNQARGSFRSAQVLLARRSEEVNDRCRGDW